MPLRLSALGSVAAFNTVTVRPRVSGQLLQVIFALTARRFAAAVQLIEALGGGWSGSLEGPSAATHG